MINVVLSGDCPFDIAINYYLIKNGNPFILKYAYTLYDKLAFLFNGKKLNIRDKRTLFEIFGSNIYPRITLIIYK